MTGAIGASIRMKVLKGVIAAVSQKQKKIYFNKKATKGAQLAFIDTTASVVLSKMLFITVHLVVQRSFNI